jgi:hypothetical protein
MIEIIMLTRACLIVLAPLSGMSGVDYLPTTSGSSHSLRGVQMGHRHEPIDNIFVKTDTCAPGDRQGVDGASPSQ